jgi:hypothetical protein
MIRIFAIFSVAAVILSGLVVPLSIAQPGMFVLGGHYYIGQGESLKEDISFYFTQVTIEEDAIVEGQVFLFSSTLDLAGYVTEDIHAFESDLTLRDSAQVDGEIAEKELIHWTFLLPALAQVP